jgi:formyltetrahydrofolate-dependent phosphoribosylglycinamide formyltransferase
MKPRIIVLISGSGTNLQALIDATQNGKLEAEITLVVSNRKAAYGLERAKNAGIPTLYFPLKPYKDAGKSRVDFDTDLAKILEQHNPDLIVLAGWMHIDSGVLCQTFLGRIINLHPALPNEFAGAKAIEDAFAAWQRGEISRSGCMVHHVIPELDAGEAIVTKGVPFIEGDTLETFASRVHEAEHQIIVEAARKILENPYIRFRRIEQYLENKGRNYTKKMSQDARLHVECMLEVGETQMALESFVYTLALEKIDIENFDIHTIYDLCLLAKLDTDEGNVFGAWEVFPTYLSTLGFNPKISTNQ